MSSTVTEQDVRPQQLSSVSSPIMANSIESSNVESLDNEINSESPSSHQNTNSITEAMMLENQEQNDSSILDSSVMPIKRSKGLEIEVPTQIETTNSEMLQNMNNTQQKAVECKSINMSDQTNDSENSKEDSSNPDKQTTFTRTDQQPSTSASQSENSKNNHSSNSSDSYQNSAYHIKWIQWKDQKTPIITQNENGPCPLIAIMNVLILKNKISLPPMMEIITAEQLMEYLGDCILDSIPKNIPEGAQLNYEQNMHDAIAILPKLQTGLDVNVKFTGVSDFEYTPECIVFDLLHISLYHGWLVDPQNLEIQVAIGNHSYNQLVERIINNKSSSQPELVTEALIAEAYLEKSASQLTYHGLCELIASLKDEELAVLFRNNHFITMYKHKNELFQLVTDQGFLTESNVVWETLNNIEGDGEFVDSNFVTVPPKEQSLPSNVTTAQQIDQDYMVALSLQEENQKLQQKDWEWEQYKEKSLGVTEPLSDEELARRLQEEENRYANAAGQERQTRPRPTTTANEVIESSSSSRSKNRDCTIL